MAHRINILAQRSGRIGNTNTAMPGTSFATDAFACGVDSKLAKIAGSVCDKCYARRLQSYRTNLQVGWTRNLRVALERIATDPEGWAQDMAAQINAYASLSQEPYHRWFDSGDLASAAMLGAIVRVCELSPTVHHWLPTRELALVRAYIRAGGSIPANLVIRASAPMIDDAPLKGWTHTSTVHSKRELGAAEYRCPKLDKGRGNKCDGTGEGTDHPPCRACWNRNVPTVSYKKH